MSSKNVKSLTINGVDYKLSGSGSGSDINIVDNLETADVESALSANQGRLLNEKIEDIETKSVTATFEEDTRTIDINFNVPAQGIIEDTLESTNPYNALSANQGKILNEKIEETSAVAKGKNKARVFNLTDDMYAWLSDKANKGVASVGDNLYIVDTEVPDWWISEVLEEPNTDGRYYEVAQLETQKVDLTNITNSINTNANNISTNANNISTNATNITEIRNDLNSHLSNLTAMGGALAHTTDTKTRVRIELSGLRGTVILLSKINTPADNLQQGYAVYVLIYERGSYKLDRLIGDHVIAVDACSFNADNSYHILDISGLYSWAVLDVISHNLLNLTSIV